jgi:hypothetical protein
LTLADSGLLAGFRKRFSPMHLALCQNQVPSITPVFGEAMIHPLRSKIARAQLEFALHAVDQGIVRRASAQEIRGALANGPMVEDSADDKVGSG